MKNILLLKGQSQYDAMRYYIDEIETGFRLLGYNTIVLDLLESSKELQLGEIKRRMKIDLVFTCNALRAENIDSLLTDSLADALYVTYLCDHPAFHWGRLRGLDHRAVVFTCDALHAKYIEEYFPNIKNVLFVPLSGSYSKKEMPYKKRMNTIVFTGSYSKPQDMYQGIVTCLDATMRKFVEYMLKDIVDNPGQTLDMCLANALHITKDEVPAGKFNELMFQFASIDAYARIYYRDKIIRTLIESGIQVHVYGNGWESFESEHLENLIIEKGNSYVAQKAVANAKISLNIMPWFKAGFQERIATAMLSGTVAVTDESQYINENFTDGKELVVYSLEHLEELPLKIKALLENEDMAERIAKAGKERAERELTWQHRTFEMVDFIKRCTGDMSPTVVSQPGEVLQIPWQVKNDRRLVTDALNGIDEILDMIEQIQTYDHMDLCDIQYLYTKFLYLFLRIRANFPELKISEFIYEYLMNLGEENLSTGIEMLILECTNIQSLFLKAEYKILKVENEAYKNKPEEHPVTEPNAHSHKVLMNRIFKNYEKCQDEEISEILETIQRKGCVSIYNQKFVSKYQALTVKDLEEVHYDSEAGMHYVDWHGKKMYYPKGQSKEFVASQVNFVNLEQDIESPHRYLEGDFDVQEGDIVIDAGVAEGNFALDIVEKAKKIYLVECEHEWVEALEKTFEPWKEKVVIIEKMLGAVDDKEHASIDTFVEEDEVNFIKMDVEGAEADSLKGASGILDRSRNIRCAICAYHRKNAERDIKALLEKHGFFTATTRGYIFFKEDLDSWVDGELRRGIVRGVKLVEATGTPVTYTEKARRIMPLRIQRNCRNQSV